MSAILPSHETLSPWWPRAVVIVMVIGFAVLIMMSMRAYQNATDSRRGAGV